MRKDKSQYNIIPSILSDIIKEKGCTIRKFSHINNTGKRYTSFKGEKDLKNKPKKRDRKSTLVLRPCHPDLKFAIDALVAGKIPEAILARIAIESASAALSLEDGTAQVDDPDDETSEDDNLGDEVSFFFNNFCHIQLNVLSTETTYDYA